MSSCPRKPCLSDNQDLLNRLSEVLHLNLLDGLINCGREENPLMMNSTLGADPSYLISGHSPLSTDLVIRVMITLLQLMDACPVGDHLSCSDHAQINPPSNTHQTANEDPPLDRHHREVE